jgi:hypothetical protein
MKKKKKIETRGRKPKPAEQIKSARIKVLFRASEIALVEAAARDRGLSRSDLCRAGLRALGVPLEFARARKPAR